MLTTAPRHSSYFDVILTTRHRNVATTSRHHRSSSRANASAPPHQQLACKRQRLHHSSAVRVEKRRCATRIRCCQTSSRQPHQRPPERAIARKAAASRARNRSQQRHRPFVTTCADKISRLRARSRPPTVAAYSPLSSGFQAAARRS
jgi:hypothetical protein